MSSSFSSEDLFAPSAETRRLSAHISVKDLEGYPLSDDQKKSYLQLRRRFLEKPVAQWDKVSNLNNHISRSDILEVFPLSLGSFPSIHDNNF